MRVRTSRRTGCPTASHMRRTWRLLALMDDQAQHAGGQDSDHGGRGDPVVELDPFAQAAQGAGLGGAVGDVGHVLLFDPVRGVGHELGERPVVGEHQQAFGGPVEAPNRKDPRGLGDESSTVARPWVPRPWTSRLAACSTSSAPDRVRRGSDHRQPPGDGDVDSPTEHGDLAVHRDPALGDQLVTGTPAAQAGPGQDLLQALPIGSGGWLVGLVQRADGRPLRGSSLVDRSRGGRPVAVLVRARPPLRARGGSPPLGAVGPPGRARGAPRTVGRSVEDGLARALGLSHRHDVAPLLEHPNDPVDVHATEVGDLRSRDGLAVRNDGQGLERCSGEPMRHLTVGEALHVGCEVGVGLERTSPATRASTNPRRWEDCSLGQEHEGLSTRSTGSSSSSASRPGSPSRPPRAGRPRSPAGARRRSSFVVVDRSDPSPVPDPIDARSSSSHAIRGPRRLALAE